MTPGAFLQLHPPTLAGRDPLSKGSCPKLVQCNSTQNLTEGEGSIYFHLK